MFGIAPCAWSGDRYISVNKFAVQLADEATVTITYCLKPKYITGNDFGNAENTVIELHDDLVRLLPLFVASRLYLEEDPGKANQYRSEYEAEKSRIYSFEYNHPEASRFVLTNGW